MVVKLTVDAKRLDTLTALMSGIGDGRIQHAAALGLNEHAGEQRRQSVVRVSSFTGIPVGYVGGKTRVRPAAPAPVMDARVVTRDAAFNIAKFGGASWNRSMSGAQATGWNVRRIYPGSFMAKGKVLRRKGEARYPLKAIWGPVLANELVRRDWKSAVPNPVMAERYMQADLAQRVLRITAVKLGFG